ncbi:TonB-dependent receptor [uncultured Parabacteroides sp.]|uniref:SusC/RagA family TonB-linked outer membrane protein n=1 Tax=uncultured Parabacteroides sp. TaxID=512312 RepID=UPI00259BCFA3|nr:TonB-dependent receptor [uncultured Parabacteroides sp.]
MKRICLFFLLLLCTVGAMGQKRSITGVVVDMTGEPIIGASIVEIGTTNGTVTDIDGKFSLSVPTNGKIQISYVGYKPETLTIKNQTVLQIKMAEDSEMLGEVVVTGYGGTQLRSKLTNSISKVKEEHLAVGLFSNPAQALSGSVAGLKVTQSTGNPAASPVIVLRGGTNLDGTGSPLILVDGQQRDDLSDINPADIESMEVLKDAGATALYGARANNGVILVSTKRGKAGHTSINVKAQVGLNYMRNPYDFMDGGDYLYWMRKSYQNAGQVFKSASGNWVGWNDMSTLKGNQPYGTGNIYWADAAKTIPADGNVNSSAVWSTMKYTDDLAFLLNQGWKTMTDPVYGDKLIYRDWDMAENNLNHPAISQDYNINISGGNDKGNYYASVGYNRTEGIPLDNFYQRVNATLNADYKIREWLTSSTNFSFSDSKWNGLPNGLERKEDLTEYDETEHNFFVRMLSAPPTLRGYNANGELLLGRDYKDGNQAVNSSKFGRDYTANKFNFGESLNFQILKDLSLKVGAIWMYDEKLKEKYNQDFLQSPGNINKTRSASGYFNRVFKQTYNAVANYSLNIKQEHSLNALVGFEYYNEAKKGFSAEGAGAPTDGLTDLGLTASGANQRTIDSWHERKAIMSYFGRVNYDYQGKYLLSATLRHDGYSVLLGDNRWGTFPGVSVGWIFGKEKFMENLQNVVSFAKLRASYGLNGNVSKIGAYELQGDYSTVSYGGLSGFEIGKLPNPSLRWEKSHTFEAGLDFGFLENKINANFTFYNRRTQDKYANIPLPGSSGFDSFKTNNGEIQNRGLEIELAFKVINTNDFKWNIGVNAAYNKNKILKLPDNGLERNRQNAFQVYDPKTKELIWVGGYQEGQEPGALYAFKYEGVYKSYDEIPGNLKDIAYKSSGLTLYGPDAWAALPESEKVGSNGKPLALPIQPGDAKFKDVNGDGVIDDYDMVKVGNTVPHWTGGINTDLTWKDFSLYVRMDYALDYKLHDFSSSWIMGNLQGTFNTLEKTKDSWTPENPNAKYPTYVWADQLGKGNYQRRSTMFTHEGSYLAFREIAFTYTMPKKLISKWNIERLAFTVTGQNLGYLTAAKDLFSPEPTEILNEDDLHLGGYPLPRSVIFGINLTF